MNKRGIFLDITPLRVSSGFRLLFVARLASLLVYGMLAVTLNVQVYAISHSSVQVGLVGLCLAVMGFLGLLVGGVWADRHDQRTLMVLARSVFVVELLILWLNAMQDSPQLAWIYVAAVLGGLSGGVSAPALMAATPNLLPRDQWMAAGALTTLSVQLGAVLGPALAGLITAFWNVQTCYLIMCFLAITTPLLLGRLPVLPPSPKAGQSSLQAAREGFGFVRRQPLLWGLLLIDMLAVGLVSPQVLFPQLARERFADEQVANMFYMAPALGAVLAALLSGWLRRNRQPLRLLLLAVLLWGVASMGFGVSVVLPWALAFLILLGMADTFSEVLRRNLLQLHTPDALQGRVSSIWLMQTSLAPAVGGLLMGLLAGVTGATVALLMGGSLCIVAMVGLGQYLLRNPSVTVLPAEQQARSSEEPTPATSSY